MRTYTNKSGETIEVSDAHLDIAIKIKEELQKASPSRRTSWTQHKRMMELEGFEDSENSESYRCMIKAEQSSRGSLPTAVKSAELLADNKIQSIKDEIGNIRLNKFEAQQEFNKLNRMKRELSKDVLLVEGVERALRDKVFVFPTYEQARESESSDKVLIVCLSDVHYGSYVDVDGFHYDTETTRTLMDIYHSKILSILQEHNIQKVNVVGLGDYFEHDSMRIQNTYNAEKTLTEQVVDFTEMVIQFLVNLSSHADVTYAAIGGNHDRIAGNKNDSIFGEHMVTVSNKIVETFVKYSQSERITYVEAKPYHHKLEVYGRNFLFVHGDTTSVKKSSVLAQQSVLHGVNFDAIIAGHYHTYSVSEVGNDKYVAIFGSMKGSDEYSLYTIGTSSRRSQGVIIVDSSGEFEIKQIKL